MKKNCILFIILLFSLSGYSQTLVSGTFTLPEEEKYLGVSWNCSETVFENKYNETEWENLMGKEEWQQAKKEALVQIVMEMSTKMEKSRITLVKEGSDFQPGYTMYICPVKLNRKGDNKSFYVIINNATGEEVGRLRLGGDGGHFGSLANLLWDGYEEAARKMGKYITSHNKTKR